MKRTVKHYVADIIDSITIISRYIDGIEESDFLENEEKQDAVIRRLQIIGEATKKVDDNTRLLYPNIPWKKEAGVRDKIVLDYDGISMDIIWDIASNYLPPLLSELEGVFKKLDQDLD